MSTCFVEDWNIIQTLGEGAFGEVKLLVHRTSGDRVAVKIINMEKPDAATAVKKETYIHKMVRHPNIIRFFAMRQEINKNYIFLEYAAGGELFNRIEPDVGMPSKEAQKYMVQLLSAVDYLHKRGVAHRDIKPENLLLDENDNIKVSDFGLATIFRLNGKERVLDKRCGTLPYLAPEVLTGKYHAAPADLWSCGIVLVAMLTGELPWDEATNLSNEYTHWFMDDYITITPWKKMDNRALSLAKKILNPEPKDRLTVDRIICQPWMQTLYDIEGRDTIDESTGKPATRQSSVMEYAPNIELPEVAVSQPLPQPMEPPSKQIMNLVKSREPVKSFSQPTSNDDLFISDSPIEFTQSPITQDNFQHLIKRMTRFFVTKNFGETISLLCSLLDKHHYTWIGDAAGAITISTVYSRKMMLVFKANIIDMDGRILVDFRLNKGCGLEFKRRFLKLRNGLSDIICKDS